jgi:hypothetical protein
LEGKAAAAARQHLMAALLLQSCLASLHLLLLLTA